MKLREARPAGASQTASGLGPVDALLATHGVTEWSPVLPARTAPRKPGRVDLTRVYDVRYAGGAAPEAVAARLARLEGVEYAEPRWVHALDAVPNDPNYGSNQRPYLERMRFPQAWDLQKGEQGAVVVAIVDGGTDWQHDDLLNNLWTNPGEVPGNGLDDDGNGFVDDVRGWNFANGTGDPTGLPSTPNNATHGTHTAGIVCAVTNNATGVAGASWNAKVMPICTGSPTNDNGIAFGYEGILYAADNGAHIVNCSWGGQGSPSNFEQEVVDYAWERDVALVAAAGNNNSSLPHYPSSYRHVLSVANVSRFDVRDLTSNYGTTVDVSAQGQSILSTFPGNGYGFSTGTSMSSPHAAAVAALVKTKWPGYTADQVLERVRVTSDNIDNVNPSRAGLLGYGRVNAEAALTKQTPAVRVTALTLSDTDGDGVVEPGENVDVTVSVTNFLAECTGLSFKLRETSAHASVVDSVAALPALDSLQTVQLPVLRLAIAPTAPIQTRIDCIVVIAATSPSYLDKDRFDFTVQPVFVNHDAGQVHTSVTSVGKLGFSLAAGGNGNDGIGFTYKGGSNFLYEGALMLGVGPTRISNAARGLVVDPPTPDDDFATIPGGVPRLQEPGPWATEQSVATFNDSLAPQPLRVRVRQDAYSYTDPVHDDYVILRYTIRNTGPTAITGLRVGWFCDWDVDGGSYITNRTGFDAARHLAYVYDTSAGGPTAYAGMQVLNAEGAVSCRGIVNDQAIAPDWGVYDGFSLTEKWDCLAGGVVHPEVGPTDVSHTIATGPFDIAPADSIEVGFAFLGGDDLAALQTHADAAVLKWQHLHSGVPVDLFDVGVLQDGADAVLRWRTGREDNLALFRVFRSRDGGPLEALQPDLEPRADHTYSFRDAGLEPGNYLYRVGEVAPDGSVQLHGGATVEIEAALPRRAFLDPARPNPFNPTTVLRFGIATAAPASLDIFDARGRRVRELLRTPQAVPGVHELVWDGRDDAGRRVASGVYMAVLQTLGTSQVRRLTLLK